MSIFNNKVLAEIDSVVPESNIKVKQVMLFTLLEMYLNKDPNDSFTSQKEFIQDISAILGRE